MGEKLVAALEELRHYTHCPIYINSGFRCDQHNANVGGANESQHTKGNAADITIVGVSILEMYGYACAIPNFNNGGIGLYPDQDFIHVDVRRGRARWGKIRGVYVSIEDAIAYMREGNDNA